jgi:S1-C subfamily serine protease
LIPQLCQISLPIGSRGAHDKQENEVMAIAGEWKIPQQVQPRPKNYDYDLTQALAAVVGLHVTVPSDAFTAETLGTERAGHGVLIDDGLVLTIGYLITEAETVWLHLADGHVAQGHALGFDSETGFGLVQALTKVPQAPLPLGSSAILTAGDPVVVAGAGGAARSVAAEVAARQEFAGYWEYLLDDAIFTAPSHPNWGGTALIGPDGKLCGIGSLQLEGGRDSAHDYLNMMVPIDLLPPILPSLTRTGRTDKPVRPWLGIYSTEAEDRVVLVGLAPNGPAARAQLRSGDVIVAVAGTPVTSLAELYRALWSLGEAGVEVPLTVHRDDVTFDVTVNSSDRAKFLKRPRLH